MNVQDLLREWRQTYSEWVSAELQLRAARNENNSGRLVPVLEQKVRLLKRHCSDCQDAASNALADRASTALTAAALIEERVGR